MAPLLSHLATEMVAAPFTSLTAIPITLITFFLALRWSTRRFNRVRNRRLLPQPSGSWPLIGHLNLFTGPEVAHKTLAKVADEYGPIFQIKLGVHTAVVVSSWEMAKECLSTNDRAFASRPRTRAFDLLGYNCAMMGFAPYGPYWREVRKIATLELLSNHRIAKLKHIGISEVRTSMKDLYRRCWAEAKQNPGAGGRDSGVVVDMQKWFSELMVNTILRLVAGVSLREIPEQDRCHKALRAFFDLTGIFTPSDALPYLRWLDLGGYEKTMKMVAKELDFFTQGWLESHKRDRESIKEKRDFMDLLLDVFDSAGDYENKSFEHDTDTVIKATSQAMVLAASDTTAVTLTWALSLLLNNPEVLRKAQDEIDSHVGSQRPVEESDTKQLVYLQAIIKETLRLYPPGPLSLPRESMDDVTVNGYHIPIGTRLFVNLHKIHRDSRVWGDRPHDFIPERFLTSHKEMDVRGQNFEMIPFGSGRRICPGLSYALQTLSFTLANVLHGFEISCPSDETIDMTEGHGLTSCKVDPLSVILVPRLSKDHYKNIA